MSKEEVINEMREEALRLLETSKTPNGKPAQSTTAIALRSVSYKIARWANTLEGKTK